jgi:hypothetical protein
VSDANHEASSQSKTALDAMFIRKVGSAAQTAVPDAGAEMDSADMTRFGRLPAQPSRLAAVAPHTLSEPPPPIENGRCVSTSKTDEPEP